MPLIRVLASQIRTTMSIATYTKVPTCMLKIVKNCEFCNAKKIEDESKVTVAVRERLVCPSKIRHVNSCGLVKIRFFSCQTFP